VWDTAFQTLGYFASAYVGINPVIGVVASNAARSVIEAKAAAWVWKHTAAPLWNKLNKAWDKITGSGHDLVGPKAHYPQFKMPPKRKSGKSLKSRSGPKLTVVNVGSKVRNPPRASAQRKATARSNYMATDGISRSRVATNTSTIEDKFAIRREKVCDINGTTLPFDNLESLYVNPGNSRLFPIFSTIASAYEMYRVNTLEFIFETEAYTASGTAQTAGLVCMATNFDPDDQTFASMTQMENYEGSVKGPPYAPIIPHDVIKAHRLRSGRGGGGNSQHLSFVNHYVYPSSNDAAPVTGQAKFYDIGLFQIAVANMVGTGIIGELYVRYSFTMIRPKQPIPGLTNLQAHITEDPINTANQGTSDWLGTAGGAVSLGSTIPIVCDEKSFTMPLLGTYFISASWFAGSGITAGPGFTLGANIFAAPSWMNNSTVNAVATYLGTASILTGFYTVAVAGTGADNTITVSGVNGLATGSVDILINMVSPILLRRFKEPSKLPDIAELLLRLAVLEKREGREERKHCSDDWSDADGPTTTPCEVQDIEDCPHPPNRFPPALKGDYVIRGDGSVVPMNPASSTLVPKASLSKSVMTSLGLG